MRAKLFGSVAFSILTCSFLVSCGTSDTAPIPEVTTPPASQSGTASVKTVTETPAPVVAPAVKIPDGFESYQDSENGFSFLYPKAAYLKTKCGADTKDELVPVSVFHQNATALVAYSKSLKNCEMAEHPALPVKMGDAGIVFEVFPAKTKEEFVAKIYGTDCVVNQKSMDKVRDFPADLEYVGIRQSDDIQKCLEDGSCPQQARVCGDAVRHFYDAKLGKGVRIQYSNADYYLQKYPTYMETMEKGAYDAEIIKSFRFTN